MQDQPLILVEGLSKSFYGHKVLDQIHLKLFPGRFYTLLGENGSGKSTLLQLIMAALRPDHGTIKIQGENVFHLPAPLREQVAYVSELVEFDSPLAVEDFMSIYSGLFKKWDHTFFLELVRDRKLDLSKKFTEYSRGQKMQLVLIAALSYHPQILLIDEVTSVLDIYGRKYFLNILNDFVKNGHLVCMTTNILSEVEHFATDVIILQSGSVKWEKPIHNMIHEFIKLKIKSDERERWDIFKDPHCYWAGINPDQSLSYIISIEEFKKYSIPHELIDLAPIGLDDIFVYYYNIQIENVRP
jgi:ABC-2 type transport system ATP-binding protein